MKGKYNPNVHASLLAAVGAYFLYLAWTLFEKYRDQAGEMDPTLNIIAIIVFALGGGWAPSGMHGIPTVRDGKGQMEMSLKMTRKIID